jgi:hypothetical protein
MSSWGKTERRIDPRSRRATHLDGWTAERLPVIFVLCATTAVAAPSRPNSPRSLGRKYFAAGKVTGDARSLRFFVKREPARSRASARRRVAVSLKVLCLSPPRRSERPSRDISSQTIQGLVLLACVALVSSSIQIRMSAQRLLLRISSVSDIQDWTSRVHCPAEDAPLPPRRLRLWGSTGTHHLSAQVFSFGLVQPRMEIGQRSGRQPAMSCLPNDILQEVFALCMPDLVFSHVCQAWRALALDTPSLWTDIDFRRDKPSRALEQLRRSCDAPLIVTFAGHRMRETRHPIEDYVSAYLARLPSIRALTFDCVYTGEVARLLNAHSDPAPTLESLSITLYNTIAFFMPQHNSPCIALGANLFGGRAPRLRELLLHDCLVDPTWHPYTHLQALTLSGRTNTMSLETVLVVLAAAPMLESLYLSDIVNSDELKSGHFSAITPLELKYLKQWSITEHARSLIELFACLSFPSLTTLAVIGHWTNDPGQLFNDVAIKLPHMQKRFSESLISLSVDNTLQVYISVRDGGSKPWLSIGLQVEFLDFYIVARCHLPFDSLTRLEMPGNAQHGISSSLAISSTWHAVLVGVPALEVLRSRGLHALELCETLLEYPDLCPRLRDFSFAPVQMLRGSADDGPTLLSRIAEVIFSRRVRGSPLARFGLHEMLPEAAVALRHVLDARGIHADLQLDDGGSDMQLWVDAEHACRNDVWLDLLT